MRRALRTTGLDPALFDIAVSGSSANQARTASEALARAGCSRLLSFGIAGGLDPAYAVGDVVFSSHVVTPALESFGERPPAAEKPTLRVVGAIRRGTICGIDRIVFTPVEKAELFAATGAAVADMESHALARTAMAHGLPFFALRAVSDGPGDHLPRYVAGAVTTEGAPRLAPILLGLARDPLSLPQLLRLKTNTDKALAALEVAAVRLLASLAAP